MACFDLVKPPSPASYTTPAKTLSAAINSGSNYGVMQLGNHSLEAFLGLLEGDAKDEAILLPDGKFLFFCA